MMSLGDKEDKLNTAIERNAYLESEQDEASAIVQRLKDETKGERKRKKKKIKSHECIVLVAAIRVVVCHICNNLPLVK